MQLKEVLATGRNYKRKHESEYRCGSSNTAMFTYEEILAEDWEVERREETFLIDYRDPSHFSVQNYERLKGKLWSVVAVEVLKEELECELTLC